MVLTTMFTTQFALATLLLMTQTANSVVVEPGKQLPQSLTIEVQADGSTAKVSIPYLLFVPANYQPDGKPTPLLLFLHGLGESGDGDLERVKIHGPAKFVDQRPDFPFILVSPQCPKPNSFDEVPTGWKPEQLIQLIDFLVKELNVDEDRIYVTGLSMGGFGTWRLVAAHPDRFAAAAPICGGGQPGEMASALARVPIWAFHGARDNVVPLKRSQEMVAAVRAAGGDARLTVYMEAAHDSWSQTYANDALYDWLLSHRRGDPAQTQR